VFYFGPGQGGDAASNAARWASQFQQPDGRASEEAMKTASLTVNGGEVLTSFFRMDMVSSRAVDLRPDQA
jgi:hypothetical protein